jgi:predicted secreted Zn-dependent protease
MKITLTLLLLLFSLNSLAEIFESVEYKYYVISPRAPQEIKPELMRNSPIREGGGSFNGHTDWYVDWKYQTTPSPHGCKLRDSRVNVRVIHTLPALSEYVTDTQTIEVFNKFNKALTQHELNHGNHGLSAAREIDKTFQRAQAQPNCHQMSRMLNSIGNTIVRKYAQKDSEYDRTTSNGFTEGAVIY